MQFKIQPARELYECFNHFSRVAHVLDDKILTAPVEMLPQYGWKMRPNGEAIRKKRQILSCPLNIPLATNML
jgi:hypothetical protein